MAASREQTRVGAARIPVEREHGAHLTGGGTAGNERLTTLVGATLIALNGTGMFHFHRH